MSRIKSLLEQDMEGSTMQRMIITIGIPASGKTYWANNFATEQEVSNGENWVVIERDAIRAEYFCKDFNINNYKFSKGKENQVTDIQEGLISKAVSSGASVIIADTNLNSKTRTRLEEIAFALCLKVEYKIFDTPLHLCSKRNMKRNATVPDSVLIRMDRELRKYLDKPVYEPVEGLPRCIIVDVDGTLADMKGIRGPFEWDKVHLDKPREAIVKLVQKYKYQNPVKIFIFTGRDGSAKDLTEMWLDKYNVPYDGILIRPEGNTENDSIIKERMYVDNIHGNYNVDFVIDDRKQVTQMWSSLGLDIIDVGNGVSDF